MIGSERKDIKMNPSYAGPREDLLALLPSDRRNVLDLGCSAGLLGKSIKQRQQARVVGAELDRHAATLAAEVLDDVYLGDLESDDFKAKYTGANFDAVICGDILEHLRDPKALLQFLVNSASAPGAVFILSLPNVGHWSTLYALWIRGHWPLNERGIHDCTHLRWFTVNDAITLAKSCQLTIDTVRKKPRMFETIHPWNGGWTERILYRLLGNLLVHQVLIRGRKA